MVEVHLEWLVLPAAIGARRIAPFAKHVASANLAALDPKALLLSIASVVIDVGWSLISLASHGQIIEHLFDLINRETTL